MQQSVRIHVENDPSVEASLRITPELLDAELSIRGIPRERLSITFNDNPQKFETLAADAEILFAGRRPTTLAFATHLKWIQSANIGQETVIPLLRPGMVLTNARGAFQEKAGEFILTAVLMLNYAIPKFVTDKQARRWAPRFERPIRGKRALLLGVGSIGGEGARRLKAEGVTTIGVSRTGLPHDYLDQSATISDLDDLLPRADFLVCSLPLTKQTAGLVDERRLSLLPKGAGIVNVGRAKVIDSNALLKALKRDHVGGAVLDVLPREPPWPFSRFWRAPNLIMTPHCSVDDLLVTQRCIGIFSDNLERYLKSLPLHNVVDPLHGY
jgi:phosphoglycerate dehydrogenase-like enzyme